MKIAFTRVVLSLAVTSAGPAMADEVVDAWRARAVEVRKLEENNAPRAYREALRLQADLPSGAAAVDRVLALNLRARAELYMAETEQAGRHARAALALAKQVGDHVGQAEADLNIELNSVNDADIAALVAAADDSLAALNGIRRPDLMAEAMLRAAMAYRRMGHMEESVEMAMRNMEMARHSGNPLALTYARQGLAISYDQSGRKQEAREHYAAMIEQAHAAHSAVLEADALLGFSTILDDTGDYSGAEKGIRNAIASYRAFGGPFYLAHGLHVLASFLNRQGRYAEALPLIDEEVEIYEARSNEIGLWWAVGARSLILQGLGRIAAAKADAERAYDLAQQIGLPLYRSQSARRLAEVFAAEGSAERAYALSVEADGMEAEAAREKMSDRMIKLAKRYQAESRQREIDELTRRNEQQAIRQRWLLTILGGSALLLLVTAGLLYKLYRINRRLGTEIDERKRTEEALALRGYALDKVQKSVFLLDKDARFLYVNEGACRNLGYTREELLGMTVFDIDPDFSRANLLESMRDMKTQGALVLETRHRTKSGTVIPVEISANYFTQEGHEYVLALVRDISERKLLERALAEREKEFRTLAENLPDNLIRYDRSCRAIYVNPAFSKSVAIDPVNLLGKTPGDATLSDLDFRDRYQAALEQVIETGTPVLIEIQVADPSGAMRVHQVSFVADRQDGEIRGAMAIGRDITPLKEAERRLSESRELLLELEGLRENARDEERKRVAHEIHDELGQVLTALKLGISTLRLQFGQENPALSGRLQELIGLADRCIQDVRNVAYSLRPAALDLGIVSALEWLASEFERHTGLVCRLDLPPATPVLNEQHAMALFRVAQEGLTNVARHSEARKANISLDCEAGVCRLSLTDDGKGFGPSSVGGKSLGLFGMQERVNRLGGTLTVESAPGQGTRISAILPVGQDCDA